MIKHFLVKLIELGLLVNSVVLALELYHNQESMWVTLVILFLGVVALVWTKAEQDK